MTDPSIPGPPPPPVQPRCPWCSSELPDPAAATCPSCHAQLVGDEAGNLPGVTAIDTEAILRARSAAGGSRRGGRLLSWISGDSDEPPVAAAPEGSLAPPSYEVRREMLRLELAAAEAELRGEAEAIRAELAEEAARSGRPPPPPLPGAPDEGPDEAAATAAEGPEALEATTEPAPGSATEAAPGPAPDAELDPPESPDQPA